MPNIDPRKVREQLPRPGTVVTGDIVTGDDDDNDDDDNEPVDDGRSKEEAAKFSEMARKSLALQMPAHLSPDIWDEKDERAEYERLKQKFAT